MTKKIQSFAYMQTHMHRFRGLRMESSVELLCGCCLNANTDGLPICWPAHMPQSVGQRASLCFTVSTCGCIRMCSCTKVCRSLRVRPRKLSRTSRIHCRLSLKAVLARLLYWDLRHLEYRPRSTKKHKEVVCSLSKVVSDHVD